MDVRASVDGSWLSTGGCISPGVSAAIPQLLWAREYGAALQADPWQFAVEFDELAQRGFTRTDLRWLLAGGHVEHREETTTPASSTRTFRSLAVGAVPPRTCLLLTDLGCRVLSPLSPLQVVTLCGAPLCGDVRPPSDSHRQPTVPVPASPASAPSQPRSPSSDSLQQSMHDPHVAEDASNPLLPESPLANSPDAIRPAWDPHLRELWLGERLVKRFRVPADNQEVILTTFEEDGWPDWIDDPLPQSRDLDPKRRLQATIKSLNRNQIAPLLRFHGNGGGSVVYWGVT